MTTPAQKITTPAQIQTDILSFREYQMREGRAEETIRSRIQALNQVSKICDLNDPEIVKTWLADKNNEHHFTKVCTWANKTKTKFIDTYSAYLKFKQIQWKPPHYTPQQKLPFIPTEEEIDQLIASCGKLTATVLQTLKETGMRIGELTQLKPEDIDIQRKTISITPEKGSNPRILPISDKLIGMITTLHKDQRAKYTTLFQCHKDTLRDYLCNQRKSASEKLKNPRLQRITFHTFRHWKGTMEFHDKKDIMHVKHILGHKTVTSTEICINLESALFTQTTENFICKIAHNPQEETELIEAGFTHINNRGDLAFYKKRK
ncbi:MAG: site-specific integrase [Candidatus Bathyarchaeia archaeon]|jgi:integrase